MLSVMKGWGEGLKALSQKKGDVIDTLEESLESARGSLLATTQQMEILKEQELVGRWRISLLPLHRRNRANHRALPQEK